MLEEQVVGFNHANGHKALSLTSQAPAQATIWYLLIFPQMLQVERTCHSKMPRNLLG